ncbi:MAG: class I SAM-dependent methyltransferase [Proteobacteria bacterium]|jgi:hypothetical protein|nr:class I SAM-dependent methyltransferase [Pseudomonadota bacterium]
MENLTPILENIDQIRHTLDELNRRVLELSINPQICSDSELQHEELKRLLSSPNWPEAICIDSLCIDEGDKKNRAVGILEVLKIFDIDPKDKKCLDYGCGEKYLVDAMAQTAKLSVGYDLLDNWHEIQKEIYDIVILYDVLDHAERETPVDILKKIKSVIHENSIIFIHFHPWCCGHGAHLYRSINKAYIQLFFNKNELKEMGCTLTPATEIIYPIRTYKQWIKDAGFKIVENEIHRSAVSEFFRQEPLLSKIEKIWGPRFTLDQMGIEFADVVIKL